MGELEEYSNDTLRKEIIDRRGTFNRKLIQAAMEAVVEASSILTREEIVPAEAVTKMQMKMIELANGIGKRKQDTSFDVIARGEYTGKEEESDLYLPPEE